MSHERIKRMKENLMSCIENQMCNIYEADCEELGEAVDMLKDLEEALYYCTITEAMEGKGKHKEYPIYDEDEIMYMRDNETSPMKARDPKEGRSPESRRMYLDSKMHGQDKTIQLRELEKYMQELSQDMVELIQEASAEEKQYMEKKLTALATKIGQMK